MKVKSRVTIASLGAAKVPGSNPNSNVLFSIESVEDWSDKVRWDSRFSSAQLQREAEAIKLAPKSKFLLFIFAP